MENVENTNLQVVDIPVETKPVEQKQGQPEEHKELRTRDKSNIFAWCLAFLIIVGSVLKWTGFFGNATISEICTVGATCWTLCCMPISVNCTIEKFFNKVS